MPARTIVCIISSILGVIALIVGLILSIVVKDVGLGMPTIFGLALLTFNGVFIGFGLREVYAFLERPDNWGKTGAGVLCGISTGLFGTAALGGQFWLILSDGPNAHLRLPVGGLLMYGLGLSVATGGLMWMVNKPPDAESQPQ
ncbi:MAG TPA: hypothetical protein VKU80_11510 [Planctomycetota bacterium]|nr:hypothetical protein [Planctomycetota bacterium]